MVVVVVVLQTPLTQFIPAAQDPFGTEAEQFELVVVLVIVMVVEVVNVVP